MTLLSYPPDGCHVPIATEPRCRGGNGWICTPRLATHFSRFSCYQRQRAHEVGTHTGNKGISNYRYQQALHFKYKEARVSCRTCAKLCTARRPSGGNFKMFDTQVGSRLKGSREDNPPIVVRPREIDRVHYLEH